MISLLVLLGLFALSVGALAFVTKGQPDNEPEDTEDGE